MFSKPRKKSLLMQTDTAIANLKSDNIVAPKSAPKRKLSNSRPVDGPNSKMDIPKRNPLKRKRTVKNEPFETVIGGKDEGFASRQAKSSRETEETKGQQRLAPLPQNKRLATYVVSATLQPTTTQINASMQLS